LKPKLDELLTQTKATTRMAELARQLKRVQLEDCYAP